MPDSGQPHRRQPTRLPHPWDSPGKNTGVGCHFLLQCMKVKGESEVAQSCPILSDPMDCSLPGSSIHGIFQPRVLEWGAIAFSLQATKASLINSKLSKKKFSLAQLNPKVSRRKEIIKIRAEITEKEIKEIIAKINKTKIWLFEKINKMDKLSA